MDKAQEKIAELVHHKERLAYQQCDTPIAKYPWKKLPASIKWSFRNEAQEILNLLEELGYRKPLDRPELREKIVEILEAHVNLQDEVAIPEAYIDAESIPGIADQILALIPDTPDEQKELERMNKELDKELPPPHGRIKNFNLGSHSPSPKG